jgi:dihydropteroate synthase
MYINCKGELMDLSTPKIMGILNVTPDSFYDGGRYTNEEKIYNRIKKLFEEGADIVDIGAFSSRPGANLPDEETEWKRLEPALNMVKNEFSDKCFSLDTYRSQIAYKAVTEYGIGIINDISAGNLDSQMYETIKTLQVPYIIMHMQGTPQTMQLNPQYNDVTLDIIKYFSEKLAHLHSMGINDVIIDPGFGFGKTLEQNYELLSNLDKFHILEQPLLVGVSRKSMIYKLLDITPQEALNGTTVVHTISLLKGANILRVHDVREAVEAIKIVGMLKQ